MLFTQEEIDRACRVVSQTKGREHVGGYHLYYKVQRGPVSIEVWPHYSYPMDSPAGISLTISGSNIRQEDDGPWWDFVRQEVDKMEAECLRENNLKVLERQKELAVIAEQFSVDPGPPPAIMVDPKPCSITIVGPQSFHNNSHWERLMICLGLRKGV